jgi:hypothetical protein
MPKKSQINEYSDNIKVERIMLAIERVSNAPNYQSVPYLNLFGKNYKGSKFYKWMT